MSEYEEHLAALQAAAEKIQPLAHCLPHLLCDWGRKVWAPGHENDDPCEKVGISILHLRSLPDSPCCRVCIDHDRLVGEITGEYAQ